MAEEPAHHSVVSVDGDRVKVMIRAEGPGGMVGDALVEMSREAYTKWTGRDATAASTSDRPDAG